MATSLYTNPVQLNSRRHANLGVRGVNDFRFARSLNAIPINLLEFSQAAKCYPIAFAGDSEAFPVAVVGLREENLFVDDQGQWKAGAYVPAYLRRFPFILGEDKASKQLSLCIENTPEFVTSVGGAPLFANGEPTLATRQALEFCNAYHTAGLATVEFSKAVVDAGLLVDREVTVALGAGRQIKLEGFKLIDQDRIRSLAAKTLGLWNNRNWLVPLYAHVQSMNNWNDLLDLMSARSKQIAS